MKLVGKAANAILDATNHSAKKAFVNTSVYTGFGFLQFFDK